ncbi:DUF1822 family protein [Leptolyngbya cf. ectocarpi LEGE 11479]|uniref:DUF1822 family protein n=2 Tax=Leptolyngbya ectocarpi TaxID=1202 RepID=A0A929FD84_LEPEC|nr:DUF1822 family protein [Leptolyngbya cf. ectocarpi LEGE 11479]
MPTMSLQQLAQRFSQRHPPCAERIYRNTLAVGAVAQYLRLLGIATDVSQSDSWHPVLQLVNDVADLYLPGYGRVECRVVEGDAADCYVPANVSCDRIAYIIVRLYLDSAEPEAALLGFATKVASERIQLHHLRSLSELPQYLNAYRDLAILTTPEG